MAKKKIVPITIVLSLIFILFCVALWLFINYHPQPLQKRLISIQRKMTKAQGSDASCFSNIDCKLVVLPTMECLPQSWIQGYSRKSADTKELQSLQVQYKDIYKRIYGDKKNLQCIREYQPKIQCLKGQCVVKLSGGTLLRY